MNRSLPRELRDLAGWAGGLLGDVVRRSLGPAGYRRVERIRREMKDLRSRGEATAARTLGRVLRRVRGWDAEKRYGVAHAFALLLELFNACENAYRTDRLRRRERRPSPGGAEAIHFVITSHPTEARSAVCILLFRRIQDVLVAALESGREDRREELLHLLELAWRVPMGRRRRPTVRDEAEHLASIVLREEILRTILASHRDGVPVFLRTWVGGDKDGHPGVGARTMRASLALSRKRLVAHVRRRIREVQGSVALLRRGDAVGRAIARRLGGRFRRLDRALGALARLRDGDGRRVSVFLHDLKRTVAAYRKDLGEVPPALRDLRDLVVAFPGMVLPLELRESASEIRSAARRPAGAPIAGMIRALRRIARGGDPEGYVRGLVVSMTESADDVGAAAELLSNEFGDPILPVIPLFETASALDSAVAVVRAFLERPGIRRAVRRRWRGRIEVMVGYSDSSKESGVLPSRVGIRKAIRGLDRAVRAEGFVPVFFHGSGGSVDRGGGSLREQTAWWPRSALRRYKATIQGEMVQRSFATPEILAGQVDVIARQAAGHRSVREPETDRRALAAFADRVAAAYRARVADPDFLEVVEWATPYPYLHHLRIGSRPTARGTTLAVEGLRAIPWVLCWTQTRVLFPTWWGVGGAWREASGPERSRLRRAYRRNPLFASFVKQLGFTLAKVEMPVWRVHLDASGLGADMADRVHRAFRREYRDALRFVRALSGEPDLLWFRPWLGESIRLRSPMIHPLNLLQIVALEDGDIRLLRETVTGIACGMLTTG